MALVWFEAPCVTRLRARRRLSCDLGINMLGITAVLDLLDRVQELQRQFDAARVGQINEPFAPPFPSYAAMAHLGSRTPNLSSESIAK